MAKNQEQTNQVIVIDPYAKIDFSAVKDVGDILRPEDMLPPILSGKEHLGEPFALLDYEETKGDFGDYLLCTVYDYNSEEVVFLSIGSALTMPVIKRLVDAGNVPVTFQLVAVGRSYHIASIKE